MTLEPSQAMGSINFEVLPVDSEDAAQGFAPGGPHQRRIREVYRHVAVLPHQLPHAGAIVVTDLQEPHTTHVDLPPRGVAGLAQTAGSRRCPVSISVK